MKFNATIIFYVSLIILAATSFASARPGDLDKSFGAGGVVTTMLPGNATGASGFALQADGKIIVAGGNTYAGDQYQPFVARYNTDGTLDQTFGTGGFVFTRFTIPNEATNADSGLYAAVAVQPDGKIVAAGTSAASSPQSNFNDAILARYNADGSLDQTFGDGGKVMTQTNTGLFQNNLNGSTLVRSLQIAPDGTIYAVGGGAFNPNSTDTSFNPIVLKYSASGAFIALNRSIVVVPAGFAGAANYGGASALQPDGKLIFANIGGFVNNFILVRVNPDLSLDSAFGANGIVQTSFNGGAVRAQADGIVIEPNGKIAVSGGDNAGNNTAGNFFAARYNANGTLDATFGSNGQVTFLASDAPLPNTRKTGGAMVRQPDGKYIVAITSGFGAIRLLPNGALDSTFGAGGFANYSLNPSGYSGAILQQPNGRIILPGQQQDGADPASHGIRMLRLTNYARDDRAEFDGDGKADLSVVRTSGNALLWYYLRTSDNQVRGFDYGISTDKIAPADYDGDGKTDLAIYRNGLWVILQSSTNTVRYANFGTSEDLPRPGDFDGDGKADISVWRPSNGFWYRLNSSDNSFASVQFGQSGDSPMIGDYDNDGKTDFCVFRPTGGVWFILRSSDLQVRVAQFGLSTDIPLSGDFDGDAQSDLAVYRPSNGFWYYASAATVNPAQNFNSIQFGASTDTPVPADYDGDGKTDVAVWRNGLYIILQSSNSQTAYRQFGAAGDLPTASAYTQQSR